MEKIFICTDCGCNTEKFSLICPKCGGQIKKRDDILNAERFIEEILSKAV